MGLDLEQGSGWGVSIPPRAVRWGCAVGRDLCETAVIVEGVVPGDGVAIGMGGHELVGGVEGVGGDGGHLCQSLGVGQGVADRVVLVLVRQAGIVLRFGQPVMRVVGVGDDGGGGEGSGQN